MECLNGESGPPPQPRPKSVHRLFLIRQDWETADVKYSEMFLMVHFHKLLKVPHNFNIYPLIVYLINTSFPPGAI